MNYYETKPAIDKAKKIVFNALNGDSILEYDREFLDDWLCNQSTDDLLRLLKEWGAEDEFKIMRIVQLSDLDRQSLLAQIDRAVNKIERLEKSELHFFCADCLRQSISTHQWCEKDGAKWMACPDCGCKQFEVKGVHI
jgi:predicted RNA-binding Zn-ribbon protein involved in translation (DUF1610 family)